MAPHGGFGETPGDWIGPYKLLRVIGEGGFGVVWLAERREPMVQRVALKIIKAGMDTRAVVARFEQERQALAVMDHPNVAKVFDGGVTPTGRPFFVMEHVAGEPITNYCDRHNLSLRERLELFIPVCEAVQHAHHKGIIHRDLKPGNILVSVREGRAAPKVIDFGIAKAISHALTDKTICTETGQLIGTPEYMSPEQAEMGRTDIDTRTDVYSLGVVLYELISGLLPLEPSRLRAAGYAAIQKMIREEEPPRPSTRLTTVDDATAAGIAGHRQNQRETLTRELRRELDWIPMKALRKDRTQRYDTPADLARDVRRYLDGEALEAGPESAGYRLRKFVRRYRGAVIAAGVVAAVLVLGIVGTSSGFVAAARWAEGERLAKIDAQEKRRLAEIKTAEAETARAAEAKANARLRRELYSAHISAAQAAIAGGDLGTARYRLELTAQSDRGWEWKYLKAMSDPASGVIEFRAESLWFDEESHRFLALSRRELVSIDPRSFIVTPIFSVTPNSLGDLAGSDPTGRFIILSNDWPVPKEEDELNVVVDVRTPDSSVTLEPFGARIESFVVSSRLGLVAGLPKGDASEAENDAERSLPIWDLRTGKLLRILGPDVHTFSWAAFDDARHHLMTLSNWRSHIFSLRTGSLNAGILIGNNLVDGKVVRRLSEAGEEATHLAILQAWDPLTGVRTGFADDSVALMQPICLDPTTGSVLVATPTGWSHYSATLGDAVTMDPLATTSNQVAGREASAIAWKSSTEAICGLKSGKVIAIQPSGATTGVTFDGHINTVTSVAVSSEDGTIAASSGDLIRLWRAQPPSMDVQLHPDNGVAFDVENSRVFVARTTRSTGAPAMMAISTSDGHTLWSVPVEATSTSVAYHTSGLVAFGTARGDVKIVRSDDGAVVADVAVGAERLTALTWSDDARFLATGSASGSLHVFARDGWRCLGKDRSVNNQITRLVFSADGNVLYAGYSNLTLKSSGPPRELGFGNSSCRIRAFHTIDASLLWSWAGEGVRERIVPGPIPISPDVAEMWEQYSAQMVGLVHSLVYSSSGRVYAALAGNTVVVLDGNTGLLQTKWLPQSLATDTHPKHGVCALAVSADSTRILFASSKGKLYVLDETLTTPLITVPLVARQPHGVSELRFGPREESLYLLVHDLYSTIVRIEAGH